MIAELTGLLARKSPDHLVIDVNGVGYLVSMSLNAYYQLPAVGARVQVLIHTHVREDALQLFGFLEPEEKQLFLLLTSVSGIGPKLAMNVLSGRPYRELEEAIQAGDLTRLVAVPGIGKKTAERIVVDLRDKVKQLPKEALAQSAPPQSAVEDEAVSALVNLGYKRGDAERIVKSVVSNGADSIEAIIRGALKKLST